MANYSFYQVHIRGEEAAVRRVARLLPDAYGDQQLSYECDTENGYVIHVSGVCQWDLNPRGDDIPFGLQDPNALEDEALYGLSLCAYANLFSCDVQAFEWCPEWPWVQFQSYKRGAPPQRMYDEGEWMSWDKTEYPTFERYCAAMELAPNEIDETCFEPIEGTEWGYHRFRVKPMFEF